MKKQILFISLLMTSIVTFSQEDLNTGILYGKNFAYSLSAPKGWILDNKSGVMQGLYAVFYKKGESWKNAEVVIYTNSASLEDSAHMNLNQLIKYDIENFKGQFPDLKIIDRNDVVIKKDLTAKIKFLSGKSYGNFEAMAYIDAGKNGIMIILSSRTQEGFDSSLNAFEELVKSYLFISDSVTIENK